MYNWQFLLCELRWDSSIHTHSLLRVYRGRKTTIVDNLVWTMSSYIYNIYFSKVFKHVDKLYYSFYSILCFNCLSVSKYIKMGLLFDSKLANWSYADGSWWRQGFSASMASPYSPPTIQTRAAQLRPWLQIHHKCGFEHGWLLSLHLSVW